MVDNEVAPLSASVDKEVAPLSGSEPAHKQSPANPENSDVRLGHTSAKCDEEHRSEKEDPFSDLNTSPPWSKIFPPVLIRWASSLLAQEDKDDIGNNRQTSTSNYNRGYRRQRGGGTGEEACLRESITSRGATVTLKESRRTRVASEDNTASTCETM